MEYKTKEEEKAKCLSEPEAETYMTGNQSMSFGDWWNRVPEEEKKKYHRAWLYHLYGDARIEIYDEKAVLK